MKKTLKCALFLTLIVLALFAITMLGASAATETDDGTPLTDENAAGLGYPVKMEYTTPDETVCAYLPSITAVADATGGMIVDGIKITLLASYEEVIPEGGDTIPVFEIAALWAGDFSDVVEGGGTLTIYGNGFTATNLTLSITDANVVINNLKITNTVTAITVISGSLQMTGCEVTTGSVVSMSITGGAVTATTSTFTTTTKENPVTATAGSLTMTDCTVVGASGGVKLGGTATITLNNCTVNGGANPTIWIVSQSNDAVFNINGGTYWNTAGAKTVHYGSKAYCTLNINGGTFANFGAQTVLEHMVATGVTSIKNATFFAASNAKNHVVILRGGSASAPIILENCKIVKTIDGAQFGKEGTITANLSTNKHSLYIATNVYITVKDCEFYSNNGAAIHIGNGSTVTVNDTKAHSDLQPAVQFTGVNITYVANGGQFSNAASGACTLHLPGNFAGSITLNGGTYIAYGSLGVLRMRSAGTSADVGHTVTATDATFYSQGQYVFSYYTAYGTINLTNCDLVNKITYTDIATGEEVTLKNNNAVKALDAAKGGANVTFTNVSANGYWVLLTGTDSTMKVYGGFMQTTAAHMFEVSGGAALDIYGGYYYRPVSGAEDKTFVRAGAVVSEAITAGTVNVWGGTFVADYTADGSVFSTYDSTSTINAAAYCGVGSASVVYDVTTDTVSVEQDASYSFAKNSIKVYSAPALRIDGNGDAANSGLRFTSYITPEFIAYVNSKKDADTTVSYATVIVPTRYLEGASHFSAESVKEALVIPATENGMMTDENGGIFIRASIYNLPHAGEGKTTTMTYQDKYAVTVYAEYTQNGVTLRQYAGYDANTHAVDPATLANAANKEIKAEAEGAYVKFVTITTNDGEVVAGYSKYNQNQHNNVIAAYAAEFADTAEVNGKIYGTLEAAIAAADEGDTVKLLKDITLEQGITVTTNVKIDGNGKTITTAEGVDLHVFTIAAGADLTVDNLTVVNSGTNTYAASVFKFAGTANLTVTGGTYTAFGVVLYGESCADSVVTLNAPTFTTTGSDKSAAAPVLVNAAFTLNINGGVYTTNENTSTGNALRIQNAGATVTINQGTFDAAGGANAIYALENTKLVLFGEDTATCKNNTGVAVLHYGLFEAFEVNGTKYSTWDAAIEAVADDGTIKILKDFSYGAKIDLNKSITIEGQGFTYTVTKAVHAFGLGSANITINNLNVTNTGDSSYGAAIFKPADVKNTTAVSGSLTLTGGTYEAYGVVLYAEFTNSSSAYTYTLNDVTFKTRGNTKKEHVASILVSSTNQTITINGGSFTASTTHTERGGAVRMTAASIVNIYGGTFDGIGNKYAIVATKGTLNVDKAAIDGCKGFTDTAISGTYNTVEAPAAE